MKASFQTQILCLYSTVVPPAPRNLTVYNTQKTTTELDWKPPLYHEYYVVTHYVIEYKRFGDVNWRNSSLVDSKVNIYKITGLKADTEYNIRLSAINFKGKGVPTKIAEIKTLSGKY